MMKKLLTLTIMVMAVALSGCSKPNETITNLQDAATAEANAVAKYAAFAERAAQDSLPKIATIFRAISEAEGIHRDNFVAELKRLGVEFTPVVEAVTVDSTLTNLYTAKSGEEYEVQSMYPEFIAIADKEKAKGAIKVFEWAVKAEQQHAQLYIEAIDALQTDGVDDAITASVVVCPRCGDTYRGGMYGDECELCGTKSEAFMTFE